jgi:hypothetical protein
MYRLKFFIYYHDDRCFAPSLAAMSWVCLLCWVSWAASPFVLSFLTQRPTSLDHTSARVVYFMLSFFLHLALSDRLLYALRPYGAHRLHRLSRRCLTR